MGTCLKTRKNGLSLEQYLIGGDIFFEKSFDVSKPIFIAGSKFRDPYNILRVHFWWSHKSKSPKNRFFQNVLKFDLNEFRCRFRVQNSSKTPQESISGHISSFRPIPAGVSKIEFSAKITIFAIFTIF